MKFANPANCAGTDVNDWFSESQKLYENKNILIRICQACEARAECLQYSLENQVVGFWAGTTEQQRRKIRKELNIIPKTLLETYSA